MSCILTSASVQDSQIVVPLMQETTQRVNYCYDLAYAGYSSQELRETSIAFGHIPLIDHNPRCGEKRTLKSSKQ
ncbi:hypothetical protein [Thorsellia kenyensis]|uniref:Transposase n=1 Tax=Thorsellia kenyensis TaxID=1549888 RepID=A0ABV6CAH4_9GAMM